MPYTCPTYVAELAVQKTYIFLILEINFLILENEFVILRIRIFINFRKLFSNITK